jgi:hypothetical protein
MADIDTIRDALKSRLRSIPNLAVTHSPSQDLFPVAIVRIPQLTYRGAMGTQPVGLWGQLDFEVLLFVGAQLTDVAVDDLAQFARAFGANSVFKAVEQDRTLGGVVEDAAVLSFRELGAEEYMEYGRWGGVFTVRVLARRG